MKRSSLIILFVFTFLCSLAKDNLSDTVKFPWIHHLSVTTGLDYVASSVDNEIREDIPNNDKIFIHTSIPLHLKYSFSFTNPRIRNYFPGSYQGIGVSLLNLGAAEKGGLNRSVKNIGYPVTVYIFQGAPIWKWNRQLSLNYEWNFGAAFGWKPYAPFNDRFNLIVGSRVNAYLNLNINFLWQINRYVGIFGGVALNHFSNGNTSIPNPGVNSFGLRTGLVWTLNPEDTDFSQVLPDIPKKRKIEYDISLWGASRKRVYKGGETPVPLNGHYICAGISFAPMVRLHRWWRVGGALDLQWDESSDLKKNYVEDTTTDDIKFYRPSFWGQTMIGISAHGELQLPIFAVNIGCGFNLLSPPENRGSYQNITLKTYLGSHLFLNIGYQLRNFQQQSSLMLGVGITL